MLNLREDQVENFIFSLDASKSYNFFELLMVHFENKIMKLEEERKFLEKRMSTALEIEQDKEIGELR